MNAINTTTAFNLSSIVFENFNQLSTTLATAIVTSSTQKKQTNMQITCTTKIIDEVHSARIFRCTQN